MAHYTLDLFTGMDIVPININDIYLDMLLPAPFNIPLNDEFLFAFLFSTLITCSVGYAIINYMVNYYYITDYKHTIQNKEKKAITQAIITYRNYKPIKFINHISITDKQISKNTMDSYLKALFTHSIVELMASTTNIMPVANNISRNIFRVLVRVRTYKTFILPKGGNDSNDSNDKSETASNNNQTTTYITRDFYLTFCFKILKNNKFSNVVMDIMNYLDKNISPMFKSRDFIIIAICNENKNSTEIEFINSLQNIKYDKKHLITVNVKNPIIVDNPNIPSTFNVMLMLPLQNVYNVFMDTYPDAIFESSKYVIDNDNREFWDGIAITNFNFY